jgi:uncharacterized protein involved in outer membrane biogenesis
MGLARAVKWGLGVVAAIVLLLLLGIVFLPRLVDVNRYAPLLAAQIETLTGRKATFGPIALKILPAPAVRVAPVAIAEGAGYPGRDFVRVEAIDVRLRLWPLFRGKVEFGSILVERPTVTVIRDRQGHWNFADLLERAEALKKQAGAPGAPPASPGAAPSIGIGEAVIQGGKLLVYDDAVTPGRRSEATIAPIEARLAGWGLARHTDADLSVGLGKSRVEVTARITGEGDAQVVEAKVARSRLETADLVPLIPWLGVARPAGLQVGGGADLEGKATVPLARPEALQFDGTITLDNLHYKDAGMTRPIEKIGGRLKVSGQRTAWEGFTAAIGHSDLSGNLTVEDYLHPRIGFALESKKLDLNELIALQVPAAPGRGGAPAAGGTGAGEGDLLSQLSAAGTLKAGSLRFQNFELTSVRGKVTLKDSVASLQGFDAAMASGAIRGEAGLDLGRSKPTYRLQAALEKIDVNALAAAYDPSLKDLLRGRLTGELALDAGGADFDAILGSARGTARIAIADGAVTSISVLKQLAALLEAAGGKGIGRDETPFDLLQGHFAIADRRATTSDLALDSKDLDLAGTGNVGLDASLDLGITARFSEEASRGLIEKTSNVKALADPQGRVTVHLLAKGPLAAPKISLDTRAQVRQVQAEKKEEIKEKVRGRLLDILGGGKKKEEKPAQPPPSEPPPPPPPR